MRRFNVPVNGLLLLAIFGLIVALGLFGSTNGITRAQEEPAATEEAEGSEGEGDMGGMMEGVVAEGFDNPRGIFYGPDGTLYVADSGSGGDTPVVGVIGEGMGGGSSSVYAVAPDGSMSVVAYGLPSFQVREEVLGASDVYADEDSIWIALGQGSQRQADTPHSPFAYAVVELDPATLAVRTYIDVYSYEAANNPDGNEIDSNPVSIDFGADGTLYIADAGANTVFSWTADGGLQPFAVYPENPVPSAVSVGPNGDIFVGFLGGFPFAEGGTRIEQLTPAGEVVATFDGLTNVVDVFVAPDGTIYASQIATFGDTGWNPDSGSVVMVTADGTETLAEGLNFPYGLAMTPDGTLVVAINAAFIPEATGAVVPVQ